MNRYRVVYTEGHGYEEDFYMDSLTEQDAVDMFRKVIPAQVTVVRVEMMVVVEDWN